MTKKILFAVLALIIIFGAAFIIWSSTPLKPMLEALAALQSDADVQVTSDGLTVFTPLGKQPSAGLIFYPGGRVDYRAYSPYLHSLASQGYLVVLVPMPLNLAVFAPDKAGAVIREFPQVKTWAVGGHSLGGAMAAHYAAQHPDQVQGLVLLAAYPAESDSLAGLATKVISIHATQDGLATPAKIEASRLLLPENTRFVTIQGGNHAQFGWYGLQGGDGVATITREEQHSQLLQATIDFMQTLAGK